MPVCLRQNVPAKYIIPDAGRLDGNQVESRYVRRSGGRMVGEATYRGETRHVCDDCGGGRAHGDEEVGASDC